MLRKVRLRSARITRPKLEAIPGAPITTWSTGSIDKVRTKRVQVAHRLAWREVLPVVACVLLALVIVAAVLLGVWLAGK